MFQKVTKKLFGSRNQRLVNQYAKAVKQINDLEESYKALSDEALKNKTAEFRDKLSNGTVLEDLLSDAFATVRETASRVLEMRHFDVQLIGGMVLNDGNIAEMRTGEGKTLVATLPIYLNALTGKGAHVVTVNDYLATRDAEWMGQIYRFLGLSVGVVTGGMMHEARQQAYAADITYGTNNEFGFDYLRDNMEFSIEGCVQRDLNFAVVDEVDSILIDEARTPLIISGPSGENSEMYIAINKLVPKLVVQQEEEGPGDYSVDEKSRQIFLTEEGHQNIEDLLSNQGLLSDGETLYDTTNINLLHHVNAALRAHVLFQKDVDYIVQDGQVVIVDEFTGRTMPGRRWSDGLHQAVEAKEGVKIQNENQTLASITFQNYFRLYNKLSGMTGTADTEAFEFQSIYGLEVVVIPTHRDMVRNDMGDLVYLTLNEKYDAIITDIKDCVQRGQPVLVGTTSIESSELISNVLKKSDIEHQVLNAKQHEKESHIITQAGMPGKVTIATNMAGRGTDIVLGGSLDAELQQSENADKADSVKAEWQKRHEAVLSSGGLHIIGTERHESRRIDNQLRGRSGRQGDSGSSRFYLSMEDNLMRIFASEKVRGLMQKLGMQSGESIEHPWVSKAIENAQRKVEAHNFDIRKNLLEYDDVANDQRKVVYEQRRDLMLEDDISENLADIREDVVDVAISEYLPAGSMDEQWDIEGLSNAFKNDFGLSFPIQQWLDDEDAVAEEEVRERMHQRVAKLFQEKQDRVGPEIMRRLEKDMMLKVLDNRWKEHLAAMDYLRQGIGLRGYAQKNPKQEYKREAFGMFQEMLELIKHETISLISRVELPTLEEIKAMEAAQQVPDNVQYQHAQADDILHPEQQQEASPQSEEQIKQEPYKRTDKKLGRNDPCHCGSGKKFKQCHGKLT
ncbi:MAG: preprotein translocase subunit SecA [Gammaproteobacteria bacterium]|nr:MAG: preprotein translocase subunit SecA [Gammaproteobacteria bacterium]